MNSTPLSASSRTALDLSPGSVQRYWRNIGVADAVSAMEAMETWTADDTYETELAILELMGRLSALPDSVLLESVSAATADVIDFMGYLKSGRALLLFRWLVDANAQLLLVLMGEARNSGTDFGIILVERMRVLERQHLLSRVFSPERLALALEVLEEFGLDSGADSHSFD